MTKWKTLAGKFTSEELEVIKEFQKQIDLNENQFVRISVIMMITIFGSLLKLVKSNVGKELSKGNQKIMKQISKYPELYAQVQPVLKKMENSYEQTLKQIAKENKPQMKKFTKKRKVGRPKAPKKRRGKPKDLGI